MGDGTVAPDVGEIICSNIFARLQEQETHTTQPKSTKFHGYSIQDEVWSRSGATELRDFEFI